jgi:hypothetical protein
VIIKSESIQVSGSSGIFCRDEFIDYGGSVSTISSNPVLK